MAWQAALEAVIHHPLFGVGVTLGAYQLALAAYERTRWVFLQPVLVSMLVVIGVLLLCGIDYDEYSASAKVLTILLGPATVALAVPLFLNLRRIRQLFWPTLLTLVVAGTLATVLGIAFGWLFGAEPRMLMSMAPKSVTSPIAMLVASQIGGGGAGRRVRTDHRGARGDPRAGAAARHRRPAPRRAGHGAGHDGPRGGHVAGLAGRRGVWCLRRPGDEPDGRCHRSAATVGGSAGCLTMPEESR